eukprot:scaffold945_cov82-Cylindrotheca_fusiformis.AAC.5
MSTVNVNKFEIDGVEITTSSPVTDVSEALVTIKKELRASLDADKKQTLFELITKKQHTLFEEMPQSIQSVKDLQQTYDLSLCLSTVETHLARYDVIGVFTIVFPVLDASGNQTGTLELDSNGKVKTSNLFAQYNELTADQVAQSTIWYRRWPDRASFPWIVENLRLSYDYFNNHMTPALWGKVLEDSQPYAKSQAMAGPLVFYYMMGRLQINSQLVVETIKTQLQNLRIDQYPGENVDDLVSHLRTLIQRLKSLQKGDISNMPHNIGKTLTDLFQTSSDKRFNEVFHARAVNAYVESLTKGDSAYGPPETILNLASKVYQNCYSSQEGWTGQFHKVNETGFSASNNKTPQKRGCFNCGSTEHSLQDCPIPKNPERIKQNKKSFWDSREKAKLEKKGTAKKNKSSPAKHNSNWPPAPTDRQKNRKKINETWHYYHFKSKKWIKCTDQSDAVNQPHCVVATSPPSQVLIPPTQPVPTPAASVAPQPVNVALREQIHALATSMNSVIDSVNRN